MSAPHISLSFLPSLCQNFNSWWKFDKVLTTKIILHSFLRHGVFCINSKTVKWNSKNTGIFSKNTVLTGDFHTGAVSPLCRWKLSVEWYRHEKLSITPSGD